MSGWIKSPYSNFWDLTAKTCLSALSDTPRRNNFGELSVLASLCSISLGLFTDVRRIPHLSPSNKKKKLSTEDFLIPFRAAVAYAEEGVAIFPLTPGTKLPFAGSKGFLDATTDLDQVKTWWTDHPDANIGIATGRAAGLFVLDVDMGDGKVGKRSLRKLVEKHGDLPTTRTIRTPSGGLHFLFTYPEHAEGEWRSSASALAPDVDVRADGGYIAAWPSTLASGGTYTPINPGAPFARLPKWLVKRARYAAPVIQTRLALDPKSIPDELRPRLESWTSHAVDGEVQRLAKMAQGAVPQGEKYRGEPWDNTTYTVACRLIEIAVAVWSPITLADVADLFVANAPRDADFGKREHARIWSSALAKASGKVLPLPVEIESLFLIPLPKAEGGIVDKFPAIHPDLYFEKAEGLLAEKAALAVNYDLAIGTDGMLWSYAASGVWERDRDVIVGRVARLLRDRYRPAHARAIEDLVMASGLPRLSGDPHEDFLNTRSGMYDWKTGKLLPHEASYLSTVQLPITLDEGAECPRFDEWLAKALPDDSIALGWEILGYMLLNGNPLQKAILLHGDGGNGKGVFLRLIQYLVGRYNTSSVTLRDISEGKFEVASLFGKLANVAGDIDSRYLRDSSRFKSLVGQDTITAQFKYRDAFEFTCWATPIFSANELWRSADTSEGYFRRWVVLPFPNKLVESDPGFSEAKLFAEAPAIFVRAMAALRDLMARGKFELGISAEILRDDFQAQSDTVRIWLGEDESVRAHDPADRTGWIKRSSLYDSFKTWGLHNGHPVVSSTKFYRRLRQLDYLEIKRDGIFGFYGIALNSHPVSIPSTGESIDDFVDAY